MDNFYCYSCDTEFTASVGCDECPYCCSDDIVEG